MGRVWQGLGLCAAAVFVVLTALLFTGDLTPLDVAVLSLVGSSPVASTLAWSASFLVVLGQRAVITPLLLLVAFLVARREGSMRAVRMAMSGFMLHNLLVGSVKFLTGRPSPLSGSDGLLVGGMLYPSGHAANCVVLWGLLCYLLVDSGRLRPRLAVLYVSVVTLVVSSSSLLLSTHWLTDLVAGVAAGLAVLAVTVLLDRVGVFTIPWFGARPAPAPAPAAERVAAAGLVSSLRESRLDAAESR